MRASLASRCVKHLLWKASITWEHFLKHFFSLFLWRPEMCIYMARAATSFQDMVFSSCYQSSSWCCTDTSFPLFPKGTGELCWAVPDEIKGKPLTWHFIISCHHWRAAAQPPGELGLGCLEEAGQGHRDQSRGCKDRLSRSLGCATGKRECGYEMQTLNPCFIACKKHPWDKPSLALNTLIILEQTVNKTFEGNLRINLAAFQALP